MASEMPRDLEGYSSSLISVITAKQGEIPWAADLEEVYQTIRQVYATFSSSSNTPDSAKQLACKVKELEKYTTVDIERHITMKNANPPYYLARVLNQLGTILSTCSSSNNNKGAFDASSSAVRTNDHLVADLQATFNEYGFCDYIEAIYDVDEATKKLEALSLKLSKIEGQSNGSIEPGVAIATLHDVQAGQEGIRQAMTEENAMRMHNKFDQISSRVRRVETSFCSEYIQSDAKVFLEYLGQQFLLRKHFVQTIFHSPSSDVVNDHMIVPGTRQWVLERIHRCLSNPEKRLYYISGKQGTGKTALSTAVCKLYNYDITACHFFDGSQGQCLHNSMNGLVQAIASGMCRTMPEYINWLDDKYGQVDLAAQLRGTWQETYRILLKEPIQDLYGIGKSASPHAKRRLVVIDGLDEMNPEDYRYFKSFTTAFMKDISSAFCLFVTVRSKHFAELITVADVTMEGIKFEDRSWMNRHIKDIEIYLSSCLGAVLSGEDKVDAPQHAKADETTLQNTVDELLKCSSGRFDYAIQLMEKFAKEFGATGQFLGSVKKATLPVRQSVGSEYDKKMSDFASPYRAYRDKEGRSDVVALGQTYDCYSCEYGSDGSDAFNCVDGPIEINRTILCLQTNTRRCYNRTVYLQSPEGEISSMSRGCAEGLGAGCIDDADFKTCQTTCNSDRCNDDIPAPVVK